MKKVLNGRIIVCFVFLIVLLILFGLYIKFGANLGSIKEVKKHGTPFTFGDQDLIIFADGIIQWENHTAVLKLDGEGQLEEEVITITFKDGLATYSTNKKIPSPPAENRR